MNNISTQYQLLFALFIALHSNHAHAYLDPGSGSAIVGLITAAIGSVWFSIKSLFYRIKGNNILDDEITIGDESIVIFSEGKAYWSTFKPLINRLIEQEVPFRYFTLDMYDPALTIDNKCMSSKLLSLKSINLSEINKVKARCVISTTPNIGTPGYPVKKSPYIEKLIHVFHHVGDISIYKKYSLDNYDEVIMAGDFQKKAIRKIESLRDLKKKKLISLGVPYLDDLYSSTSRTDKAKNKNTTILVGSSWGSKGCLRQYGVDFINKLANAGYNVIVRPHPQSAKSEPEFIDKCKEATSHTNVIWDEVPSPSHSMNESDLLISDTSAIRFDYAFLHEKPIITLDIPKDKLSEFELSDLNESWYESASLRIGRVLNKDSVCHLNEIVDETLRSNFISDIRTFRQETVQNFGNSAPHVVDYILKANSIKG
ncbi:CDP-glycerol glycerophosphotransferase family protein [Vibrio sp. HN007]|uniref:CDP-glycerol glycerophosphotransferase family protein n=1 Tax=Vibrio iocasae TaxID=3098914 RepID=UPI0035D455D0